MNQIELYFLEKAREFKKIEQEFIKFTYEAKTPENKRDSKRFMGKAIELAYDAVEKRNEILGEMHDVSGIEVNDPDVKSTIEKLRKNERFESLNFAETLANLLNKNIDNYNERFRTELRDYFFEDKYDELWDDFFSWFSFPDYYYRKAQIGAIIYSSKLPSNILQYFDEIKEAFAYGLDRSCISLSRALLEIALHDKLKRKGYFKKSNNRRNGTVIDLVKEDPLNRFIIAAKINKLITPNQKDLAMEIKDRGNNVLHIKDTKEFSVRGLALRTIQDTIELIEHLYR